MPTVTVIIPHDVLEFQFDDIAEALDFAVEVADGGRDGYVKDDDSVVHRFTGKHAPIVLHFQVVTCGQRFIGYSDLWAQAFDIGREDYDLCDSYREAVFRDLEIIQIECEGCYDTMYRVEFIGYSRRTD